MHYSIRRVFSTIKDQVSTLKHPDFFNVPENILNLADRNLLTVENHPICIIKEQIKRSLGSKFKVRLSDLELRRSESHRQHIEQLWRAQCPQGSYIPQQKRYLLPQ